MTTPVTTPGRCVAYSWVKDYRAATEDMVRSFHRFHPDVPFILFDWEACEATGVPMNCLYAALGKQLASDYDVVMHLDGDMVITAPLTRALETQADIAGVRANPDIGLAHGSPFTRINRLTGEYTRVDQEMNVGLFVVRNPLFWDAWTKSNREYAHKVYCAEQDTWNDLAGSGRFTSELLDPVDGEEIWGTAANFGTNYLDSWRYLRVDDGGLYLGESGKGKHIHCLHLAGEGWEDKHLGFGHPRVREVLTPEVRGFIDDLRGRTV